MLSGAAASAEIFSGACGGGTSPIWMLTSNAASSRGSPKPLQRGTLRTPGRRHDTGTAARARVDDSPNTPSSITASRSTADSGIAIWDGSVHGRESAWVQTSRCWAYTHCVQVRVSARGVVWRGSISAAAFLQFGEKARKKVGVRMLIFFTTTRGKPRALAPKDG